MVATEIVGCILKGTLAERPTHAAYLSGYIYYVSSGVNLGDLYWNDGTTWVLLQGASKQETLQNKIIPASLNTITGIPSDPFTSGKRDGWITPALSAAASLQNALKGMPSVGTYSLEYDATEGYFSRFATSIAERIGWFSTTLPLVTKRDYNPRLKIRSRITPTGNMSIWVGFSNSAPALSGFPFNNSAQFFVMGMSASYTTNFQIVRNDGTNDGGLATSTGVTKNANWNTFEITMTNTNVIAKINTTEINVSVRIPSISENLYLMIFGYNSEAVAKNLDIVKCYFSSDIV